MTLQLEAIKFNHDVSSVNSDALNLRKNATTFVHVPEWRRGISVNPEDSPVAYAMKPTEGNQITIQAQFRSTDPELQSVEVRAIDATYQPRPGPGGCLGILRKLLSALARLLAGNVLGEVKARTITIPASGLTGFESFELVQVSLWAAGVGARTTDWQWQYRRGPSDPWNDIERTVHRIYSVVDVPQDPWSQTPYSAANTALPWTDVLDYSCNWALLAKDVDTAAGQVTRRVNQLGPSVITYDCPGGGGTHYSGGSFNATKFVERLRGGFGLGQYVNCTDCATIVSTFANILGATLWQSRMEEPPSSLNFGFDLNPLFAIGASVWQTACGWSGFNYHEVAWKGSCTASDEVFDACLHVDGDANPTASPHTKMLPINLEFGAVGAGLYRDRLATPAGRPDCEPNPGSRQRRSVI
ncbi:MAG: hypothetical protein GY906_05175 [bacterium]|nr:hypothetical protein [bacterium]